MKIEKPKAYRDIGFAFNYLMLPLISLNQKTPLKGSFKGWFEGMEYIEWAVFDWNISKEDEKVIIEKAKTLSKKLSK